MVTILLFYLIGMFICAYILGRIHHGEVAGGLILWPVFVVIIPLVYLLDYVIKLGEKHNG